MNKSRLRDALRLYCLTDENMVSSERLPAAVKMAIEGGATCIQYRVKEKGIRPAIEEGRKIVGICRERGVLFIVNDRVDLAQAVGADGVHLGEKDMPPAVARDILGEEWIIGVSADSPKKARRAVKAGADYVGAGPLFFTPTKPDAGNPLGFDGLGEVVRAVSVPVVAIGGVNAGNAARVMETKAAGVAVVSAVMAADDPRAAAREMAAAVGRGLEVS